MGELILLVVIGILYIAVSFVYEYFKEKEV